MFKIGLIVLIAITLPWTTEATYCDYLLGLDCFHMADVTKVCGTDGKTYWNSCALSQAHCRNTTIDKASDNPCPTAAPTTTAKPVDGALVAFDIFCMDVAYIDCPSGGASVCGSDGTKYANLCEFDKYRCSHRPLLVQPCP